MGWALVVAMPLWFGSCKKENGGGGDPVTPNSIVGSWKVSAMTLKDDKNSVDYLALLKTYIGEDGVACLTDTKGTFNSDGSITGTPSPSCKSTGSDEYNPVQDKSTWKVADNKLTITDSDGAETYDLKVSGNTMTWSTQEQEDTDGDGKPETYTTTIEFKRV
ncbi:hypothetical protein GCM10028773_02070 [Spirosoma koreense]